MQTLDAIKALHRKLVNLESIQKIIAYSCYLFIFCNEVYQDLESSASGRTPFS